MRCHACNAFTQFCGTSEDGTIEWYVCGRCDHVQFVAVTTKAPVDPTAAASCDGHMGAVER